MLTSPFFNKSRRCGFPRVGFLIKADSFGLNV